MRDKALYPNKGISYTVRYITHYATHVGTSCKWTLHTQKRALLMGRLPESWMIVTSYWGWSKGVEPGMAAVHRARGWFSVLLFNKQLKYHGPTSALMATSVQTSWPKEVQAWYWTMLWHKQSDRQSANQQMGQGPISQAMVWLLWTNSR